MNHNEIGERIEQLSFIKEKEVRKKPAKRVDIVKVQLLKEKSILYKNRAICSPKDSYDLMIQFLGEVDRKYFLVVCLDTKNQPTSLNICHVGSLNASLVHPREVFKPAILSNVASIIVGHNHRSGQPDPSQEDIHVTKRLSEAGKIVGIEVLNHIILGDDRFVSLKEKGYL
ncbi:JAB domain-containing protein [Bacillus safensis]|uniref:JAB domain-containing protein n=1 Tax=Bacillus safensis TaxID=561879 RepID=UPI002452A13D|nr:JAB domain-containing protein [Bacillus safensis]MDH3094451.1 JAB domain-containing protein [Bacillus safensis]